MNALQSLIYQLYQIGAVQFGEFKLKSGETSSVYINLRKIISYPSILQAIAHAMWEKVGHSQHDLICGVPYTALPIATCLSLEHHIPMVMRRKEKKDYGTKQLIEGEFKVGQTCLIIEDVITTGSSILETAADLQEAGLKIKEVIAFIDRKQGGKENLAKQFQAHAIVTLPELLKTLIHSDLLDDTKRSLAAKFLAEKFS